MVARNSRPRHDSSPPPACLVLGAPAPRRARPALPHFWNPAADPEIWTDRRIPGWVTGYVRRFWQVKLALALILHLIVCSPSAFFHAAHGLRLLSLHLVVSVLINPHIGKVLTRVRTLTHTHTHAQALTLSHVPTLVPYSSPFRGPGFPGPREAQGGVPPVARRLSSLVCRLSSG